MAELVKTWNDGGSLTATYEGSGDGSAVFSSDPYEGIDREQSVIFRDSGKTIAVERTVRQEGIRQQFVTSDGKVFRVANDGRFGVLKVGEPIVPPTPMETYTLLSFIECTGEQYIDTGYIVQEDDVIDMYYIAETQTNADKCLFGVYGEEGRVFMSIYSNTAYVRFGTLNTSSATVSNARTKYVVKLQKGSVDIDGSKASPAFDGMPQFPLYLFACNQSNRSINMYGIFRTMGFKISKASGEVVMNLKPCKRDSDGKVGMLDLVSGKFCSNLGTGADFISGNEMKITDDYELLDYIAFNNDKTYNTGIYANERSGVEVMFRRTDTSGADYMFGISSGNRFTGYLTSSGYWRFGNGAPIFNTNNKNLQHGVVTPGKTTVNGTANTFTVGDAFVTDYPIPIGGYTPASGVPTATYQGYMYFFRMKEGDVYVADLVPCKRLSDGVEGFWDCVTQTFIEPL